MADDKVTPTPDQEPVNPVIENDPEVLAEVKKNRILHLKLERWKDSAAAVGVVLQTFKAEAMSLISGVGTLVVGWFQIRKMVAKGRAEVRAAGRAQGVAEGRMAGRAAERQERQVDKQEQVAQSKPAKAKPMAVATVEVPAPEMTELAGNSFMMDPMNYVTVGLPVVFIWSSIIIWLKKKRKKLAEQGGKS